MAGQGEKNNEADVRLLFSRKEVFPLSPHHLPISKALSKRARRSRFQQLFSGEKPLPAKKSFKY
jgi:hypothetical protein